MSGLPPMTHLMDHQKTANDRDFRYVGAKVDGVGVFMVFSGKVACRSELLPSSRRKILIRFNDDYTDPRASCIGRRNEHSLRKHIGRSFTRWNHECWVA